jgi:hypothetical protein
MKIDGKIKCPVLSVEQLRSQIRDVVRPENILGDVEELVMGLQI